MCAASAVIRRCVRCKRITIVRWQQPTSTRWNAFKTWSPTRRIANAINYEGGQRKRCVILIQRLSDAAQWISVTSVAGELLLAYLFIKLSCIYDQPLQLWYRLLLLNSAKSMRGNTATGFLTARGHLVPPPPSSNWKTRVTGCYRAIK